MMSVCQRDTHRSIEIVALDCLPPCYCESLHWFALKRPRDLTCNALTQQPVPVGATNCSTNEKAVTIAMEVRPSLARPLHHAGNLHRAPLSAARGRNALFVEVACDCPQ